MIREKIILNNNVFIADYYNSANDAENSTETKFVFIRNYDIINGITNDKDIYIIEKSIYLEAIDNIIKSQNITDDIIYPILNNNALYYTNNYELFNGLFIVVVSCLVRTFSLFSSFGFDVSCFSLFIVLDSSTSIWFIF